MDSAIKVAFEVEKYDKDKFRVVRQSWKNNGYGWHDRKDETSEILLDGLDIHNATYICHVYNYFWRNKQIELTDEFLKEKEISPSALAYYYVKESLGSEWGIHNGHKLLDDTHGLLVGQQGFKLGLDALGAVVAQVAHDLVADGDSGKILKKSHKRVCFYVLVCCCVSYCPGGVMSRMYGQNT